jgi:hemolysin III
MMGLKPKRQDVFSSYSHLAGVFFAFIGVVILICRAWPHLPLVLISAVYGCGAILMLLSSGLYHGFKKADNQSGILRKLDHISIFVMIAGTYTPLCYVYLTGGMQWGLITAQWALVIAGFFISIFWINAPRVLTTLIYLLMGWMAIIPLKQLVTGMSVHSLILLIIGGIAYSIGAICYIIKKPNPMPGFFGFHEIFHVCILVGALAHYVVILKAINFVR